MCLLGGMVRLLEGVVRRFVRRFVGRYGVFVGRYQGSHSHGKAWKNGQKK